MSARLEGWQRWVELQNTGRQKWGGGKPIDLSGPRTEIYVTAMSSYYAGWMDALRAEKDS